MVPLPHASQRICIEVLVALIRSMGHDIGIDLRLEPCAWRTTQISLKPKHWPAVFPSDGGESDRTANGMEIHHEQSPPLSALIFHDTPLMDIGASRSVLIHFRDNELRTIFADAVFLTMWHLCGRGRMIAEGLIGSDGDRLVGPPDTLGTRTEGTTIGLVIGRDEVVDTTYFIYMMPLANCIALRNDGTLRLFDWTTHIWSQFCTLHFSVAMDGINLSVVIEKHGEVVDPSLHVVMLPRSPDILGGIALQALAVDIGEDIEQTIGITNSRCPDTLTVYLFVALKRESIIGEVEAVEAIRDILPVH